LIDSHCRSGRPVKAINAETRTWDTAALLDACALLSVPALLVHGAEDPRPPYAIDDLVQALPNADIAIIDDAGHTPWLERPGTVVSILRPWINHLCQGRPTAESPKSISKNASRR
jgi:pimeloyl-ACP methyl ester carboxylesterase